MSPRSNVMQGFFLVLMLFGASASANSQFESISADAKYVAVGFVTSVNAVAKQKKTSTTFTHSFDVGARSNKDYYSSAQVTVQNVVEGIGDKKVRGQSDIRVCTGQSLIAGASYLFFLGDEENSKRNCLQASVFLLGDIPGQDVVPGVVVTDDVLLLLPEHVTLYEDGVALPSAVFVKGLCPGNLAVLKTYVKLEDFLRLVRKARAESAHATSAH